MNAAERVADQNGPSADWHGEDGCGVEIERQTPVVTVDVADAQAAE